MLEITFKNQTTTKMDQWEQQATVLIESLIKKLKIKLDVSLSINFVNKPEALKLNQDFRKEKYVPDVISFPSGIDQKTAKQMGTYELGDLFICFAVAKQKAKYYHHELETEMAFLFVHGTLHLLGYDHETPKDQKKMFKLQEKILKENQIEYLVIYDDLDYLEE